MDSNCDFPCKSKESKSLCDANVNCRYAWTTCLRNLQINLAHYVQWNVLFCWGIGLWTALCAIDVYRSDVLTIDQDWTLHMNTAYKITTHVQPLKDPSHHVPKSHYLWNFVWYSRTLMDSIEILMLTCFIITVLCMKKHVKRRWEQLILTNNTLHEMLRFQLIFNEEFRLMFSTLFHLSKIFGQSPSSIVNKNETDVISEDTDLRNHEKVVPGENIACSLNNTEREIFSNNAQVVSNEEVQGFDTRRVSDINVLANDLQINDLDCHQCTQSLHGLETETCSSVESIISIDDAENSKLKRTDIIETNRSCLLNYAGSNAGIISSSPAFQKLLFTVRRNKLSCPYV